MKSKFKIEKYVNSYSKKEDNQTENNLNDVENIISKG